ncbi:MAG: hypothetical protein CMF17_11755 [Idiomarinaceae bacterium]|nr:hypothetical protein [Idiomarinaceae bacterium]
MVELMLDCGAGRLNLEEFVAEIRRATTVNLLIGANNDVPSFAIDLTGEQVESLVAQMWDDPELMIDCGYCGETNTLTVLTD